VSDTAIRLAIIGLGYVGLPIAVAFAEKVDVLGFDINPWRVESLKKGEDQTGEVDSALLRLPRLRFSDDTKDLRWANFYIVTVPTPVDSVKHPDFSALKLASSTIGAVLKKGDYVVFESTVYPGATEEICIPLLEYHSGLKEGSDFHVGYSPERINPGDQEHTFTRIKKVVAANDQQALAHIAKVYGMAVEAGIYPVSSIKVAEAAKVIENTQRDLNIALVNELALICERLHIDTTEVLDAAATKWNFLPFKPGLVGGHCIGVDPYYLTYKAQSLGYMPEVILAGRRMNDRMGAYIANRLVRCMAQKNLPISGARVLVLGLTFKENCKDVRNSKVIDIVHALQDYNMIVNVYDPVADQNAALKEYGLSVEQKPQEGYFDAIIIAVAHRVFIDLGIEAIRRFGKSTSMIFDVKSIFPKHTTDARL
jgi:UDP-N-acetyl-D-galactosamine dehydrogenase